MAFDGTAVGICRQGHKTILPNDWGGGITECPKCSEVISHVDWDLPMLEVKKALSARIQAKDPKRSSKERVRLEIRTGKEASQLTKSGWVEKERRIDKTDNAATYDEIVIDPDTGDVIHELHEALEDHKGHGSAKFKDE
jgi:hypothetical protein